MTDETEERLSGVGGGAVATIAGLNRYQTPFQLWEILTRKREPEQPTAPMKRGLMLEPYVDALYRQESGLVTSGPVFLRSESDPWMIGHLDNLAGPQDLAAYARPEQLSAWDRVQDSKTTRPELRRMWGEPGSADVPLTIQAQMQWYMMLSKKSLADVAACFGFDDFVIFQVPYDPDAAGLLYEAAYKFWHNHVLADIPPPLTGPDAPRVFRKDDGSIRVADATTLHHVTRLTALTEQLKMLESVIEQNRDEIKLAMGDASVLKDPDGRILATWKAAKPSARIDLDRLRTEQPAIAEAYTVTSEPSRRFLLK